VCVICGGRGYFGWGLFVEVGVGFFVACVRKGFGVSLGVGFGGFGLV